MRYPKPKPEIVLLEGLNGVYDFEAKLKALKAEREMRELKVSFTGESKMLVGGSVTNTTALADLMRRIIGDDMDIQEVFVVVFLNAQLLPIGYFRHTKGTTNTTLVDFKIIFAAALIVLAENLAVCHNHPQGNTEPSKADRDTTTKLKSASKTYGINILDHIIVNTKDYYSFRRNGHLNGFSGFENIMPQTNTKIVTELRTAIFEALKLVTKANSPFVFAQIQTKEGYERMEQKVLNLMLSQRLQPEEAIPLIEQEYGN